MKSLLMKYGSFAATALLFWFTAAGAADYSDGEIAAILRAVDQSEIKAANEAQKKATRPQVRSFASKMIKEHSKNTNEVSEIVRKEAIDLDTTTKEVGIKTKGLVDRAELKVRDGKDFDRAYIESQIEAHRDLIRDIDTEYIPDAQSKELKDHLESTRRHVQNHLEEARRIEATL
jgi:putative membrane protein